MGRVSSLLCGTRKLSSAGATTREGVRPLRRLGDTDRRRWQQQTREELRRFLSMERLHLFDKSCTRLPRCQTSSIQEQFVATIMVLLPKQQASHTVVHVHAPRRMAVFRMWKRWSTSCIKCFGCVELSSSGVYTCLVLKPWRRSSMLSC